FAAGCGYQPQRLHHVGVRPLAAIGRRGKHDGATVGCPRRREILATRAELTAEARVRDKLRAGEQVTRRRSGLERLHEQTRPPLVEPMIPQPDRRGVVYARVVLARTP